MKTNLNSDKTDPGADSPNVLCSVADVHKAYDRQSVLNGVSISIDVGELAGLRSGCVSTVFQFFHLLPTLPAYENIELSLQLVPHFSPAASQR